MLQDEDDTSTRTRVIPVVNLSYSSCYNAFGPFEVYLILSVLGLLVNLIQAQNRFFARPTMQIRSAELERTKHGKMVFQMTF